MSGDDEEQLTHEEAARAIQEEPALQPDPDAPDENPGIDDDARTPSSDS